MPVILRINERIEQTPKLYKTLQQILGRSYEIQTIFNEPDLHTSFQLRVESLRQAFLFLLDIFPTQQSKTDIQTYLTWCDEQYLFDILTAPMTIDDYQQRLARYTCDLINGIIDFGAPQNPYAPLNLISGINLLNKAEQYYLLTIERPELATLTTLPHDDNHYILIYNKPIRPLTTETQQELILIQNADSIMDHPELPNWFNHLPKIEQALLHHALKRCDLKNPEVLMSIPSRLRTIPGLANAAEESWKLIDQETGKITHLGSCLRSAHIASRDSMFFPADIQTLHTERNLEQLQKQSGHQQLFLQTLISPIWILDNITHDYFLEQQRVTSIAKVNLEDKKILTSNHPFNIARTILTTPVDSAECTAILEYATASLNHSSKPTELTLLITEYKNTLNSGLGTAYFLDWNGRELFLSSLEQLIVMHTNSVSYGSCVSGKDRKAISLLHTLAMIIFHHKQKKWPSYIDRGADRELFIQIVAHLYLSFHHHYFSGQNAPGSNGIKTPHEYFPSDICESIKKQSGNPSILTQDDRLASNNEVKDIIYNELEQVKTQRATTILAALQLENAYREQFIVLIKSITQHKNFWRSKTNAAKADLFTLSGVLGKVGLFANTVPSIAYLTLPTGIYEINRLLTKSIVQSNIDLLSNIYQLVNERLEVKSTQRDPLTQKFYQYIQDIGQSKTPNDTFLANLPELNHIQEMVCATSIHDDSTAEANYVIS